MAQRPPGLLRLSVSSLLLVALFASRPLEGQLEPPLILGLERNTNNLVLFSAAAPGTILSTMPVAGLVAGETLRAIDVRPATGGLYGIGVNAGGSQLHVYFIFLNGALWSARQIQMVGGLGGGAFWGMSFNPVNDRIRVVNDFDLNLRLSFVAAPMTDTSLSPASAIVESIAYDSQIRGATSTTLFTLNLNNNSFSRIGGVGGLPSPNLGALTLVGAVGPDFHTEATGLDIASNGTVYASLNTGAGSELYTIDRATGAGTLIGDIGSSLDIDNIAVLETPVGVADSYITPFGTPLVIAAPGVLQNDSDPELTILTAEPLDAPDHGVLSMATDGSFTYTPNAGFAGQDSFSYSASDGILTDVATVSLTVSANQPPSVAPPPSQGAIDSGGGVTFGPLAFSVTDPEGAAVALTAASSHPAVIDPSGITLGGSGSSRTITISSVPGSPGGPVTITLQGSDGYATTAATFTVTVTPQRGAPLALTNLSARNTASLQWQAPPYSSEAVTGYLLEAGYGPGAIAVSVALGATSFATPAPDGIYYVRVRSQASGGLSAASNEVVVALGQAAPPLTPLALLATVQGNNVALQWTENPLGPVITSYQVQVGTAPGASNLVVVPLSGAATTFSASGPSGTYYLRVSALNAAGGSGPSNEATLVLGPGTCTPPAAPVGLTSSVNGGVVTLKWMPPASGAIPSAYRLEAGSTPGASNIGVFTLPPTASVTSPAPSGNYYVRLAAVNACGGSALSPELLFTVP